MVNTKTRRIFLAINLPEQTKKKLLEFQSAWSDLPVRWTKGCNLHITLIFIGYVDDEQMLEICQLVRQTVQKYRAFEIKLKRICLGPPHRPARMIWVEGERNPVLTQLKSDLEEKLFQSVKSGYHQLEKRTFQIHLTLARIKTELWRSGPNKFQIDKEISLVFPVNSIEVMQSHLSRGGADYVILESVELAG